MTKHLFCKSCDCNVGVSRIQFTDKIKIYECNNCSGEIVIKRRVSAKQKKTNDFLKKLLSE